MDILGISQLICHHRFISAPPSQLGSQAAAAIATNAELFKLAVLLPWKREKEGIHLGEKRFKKDENL